MTPPSLGCRLVDLGMTREVSLLDHQHAHLDGLHLPVSLDGGQRVEVDSAKPYFTFGPSHTITSQPSRQGQAVTFEIHRRSPAQPLPSASKPSPESAVPSPTPCDGAIWRRRYADRRQRGGMGTACAIGDVADHRRRRSRSAERNKRTRADPPVEQRHPLELPLLRGSGCAPGRNSTPMRSSWWWSPIARSDIRACAPGGPRRRTGGSGQFRDRLAEADGAGRGLAHRHHAADHHRHALACIGEALTTTLSWVKPQAPRRREAAAPVLLEPINVPRACCSPSERLSEIV